jgi:hypothetical protein
MKSVLIVAAINAALCSSALAACDTFECMEAERQQRQIIEQQRRIIGEQKRIRLDALPRDDIGSRIRIILEPHE